MKRILFLSLAILLMGGVAFAATPGSEQSPGVGDIMGQGDLPSDPHRIFRLVRWMPLSSAVDPANLTAFVTLTADSIVIWDLVSDDGVTVTVTTTSYDSAVAGIVPIAILGPLTSGNGRTAIQDIGARNWGWLQTYGKAQVDLGAEAIATAGSAMGCDDTTGGAALFYPSTSNAALNGKAGFFYDTAVASAANIECFLNID